MAEGQEHPGPAVGPASDGRAPAVLPPLVPTLDEDGQVVLERGEAHIGALPAHGVRFRSRHGNIDQRWGPLDMTATLTTHRVVLIATPGTSADAPWSTAGTVPFALRAIEPPQTLRGVTPVRIAGHVRWSRVTRVETEGSLVIVTMPASLRSEANLALRVQVQLGHRFLAIARAAFVAGKRPLSVDTPGVVEAPLRL